MKVTIRIIISILISPFYLIGIITGVVRVLFAATILLAWEKSTDVRNDISSWVNKKMKANLRHD